MYNVNVRILNTLHYTIYTTKINIKISYAINISPKKENSQNSKSKVKLSCLKDTNNVRRKLDREAEIEQTESEALYTSIIILYNIVYVNTAHKLTASLYITHCYTPTYI